MDKKILIFSGMPASGKDTVTEKMCIENKRFEAFKKHRSVNSGDKLKNTYYNISTEEFEKKIEAKDFIQYHKRYNRYYGIDKKVLFEYLQQDIIPIIHIGRIENYYSFKENFLDFCNKYNIDAKIIHIQLWETLDTIEKRIIGRGESKTETKDRIEAAKQEFQDCAKLISQNKKPFTAIIRNTELLKTVDIINHLVFSDHCSSDLGYEEFKAYIKNLRV